MEIEAEPLESEKAQWRQERMRVLDEWCEIELKGSDALKGDVTQEPGTETDTVASETPLQDLYPLLAGPATSSIELVEGDGKEPSTSQTQNQNQKSTGNRSTFNRILDICLCRPTKTQMYPLVYTQKSLIIKLAQIPYDNSNGTHWLLLSDYFTNVTRVMSSADDVTLKPSRVGPHWVTVGFQSASPETDFRGCGVLGLLQMHSFTQRIPDNVLRAMVLLATTEPNDFPLAVVSINITSLLLTQLKNGTFDSFGTETEGIYPFFASLHAAAIAQFCSIYKKRACTLAHTQSIFNEIVHQLEKSPLTLLMLLNPNNDDLISTFL